jgi:hypothetical protein
MEYKIDYRYEEDNIGDIVSNKKVEKPKKIMWTFEDQTHLIESRLEFGTTRSENGEMKVIVINEIYDLIKSAYLFDNCLLLLYSDNSKYNNVFPAPDNLILYNLKKEIIKTIETPKPLQYKENNLLTINSLGEVKIIDNVKHLLVIISTGDHDSGFSEFRYLNLETFEYNSSYYEIQETFGQYSKTPTRCEEFGR